MAKVTYIAPEDDSEVVVYMGQKFFNGLAVEVTDEALLAKAETNPFFEVAGSTRRKPGRPAKVEAPASDPEQVEDERE